MWSVAQREGPDPRISGHSIAGPVGVCPLVPLGCFDMPGGHPFLQAWLLYPASLSFLLHRLWMRNAGYNYLSVLYLFSHAMAVRGR